MFKRLSAKYRDYKESCKKAAEEAVKKSQEEREATNAFYNDMRNYKYHLMSRTDDPKYVSHYLEQSVNDLGELSDGYHTFNELYYYRMLYNAAFFNSLAFYDDWADGSWEVEFDVHKSKKHNDGEDCFGGGWFIVMAELPTGQISNHYEMKYWDLFKIPEKEIANKWDGHTPAEAAERLNKFLSQK